MKLKSIIMGASLLMAASGVSAQSQIDRLASQVVYEISPEARSLAAQNAAQVQALKAENQLEAPEVEVENLWPHRGGDDNKLTVGVTQGFEWPGIYSARNRAIKAQESALDLMAQSQLRDKYIAVKQALIEIVYLKQKAALMAKANEHVDSLVAINTRAFQQGETSILDLNRLRIEALKTETESLLAREQVEMSIQSLGSFGVSDPAAIAAQLPAELPAMSLLPRQAYEQGLANDPQVLAQRATSQAARQQQRVAKQKSLPGFSLGYRFNREDWTSFSGFAVSMSLPFLKKNRESAQQEALALAADLDAESALLAARATMLAEYARAQLLAKQCQRYQEVFDSSDNIRLLDMALRGGQITMAEYLFDLNYFIEARLAQLDLQYQTAAAITTLSKWQE